MGTQSQWAMHQRGYMKTPPTQPSKQNLEMVVYLGIKVVPDGFPVSLPLESSHSEVSPVHECQG